MEKSQNELPTQFEIRNCVFAFKCDAEWEKLEDANIEQVRQCRACNRDVHLCVTDKELNAAIRANHCVAIERIKPTGVVEIMLAEIAATEAWELSAALAGSFRTTVRSVEADGELIPQYDVEHVADTEEGQVRIAIKTWRRNLDVEVLGGELAVNALNAQMTLVALTA